ncbi:hypothetical protein [Helicobacter sp. T3_23-1056]
MTMAYTPYRHCERARKRERGNLIRFYFFVILSFCCHCENCASKIVATNYDYVVFPSLRAQLVARGNL